jgi:hypothetical protein
MFLNSLSVPSSSLNIPPFKMAPAGYPEMLHLNKNQCSGTFLNSEDLTLTPLLSGRLYGDYTSKAFM